MLTSAERRALHIALVGNPNTGKSTLFNALCGMRQRVGNYAGVTVEKKLGRCELGGVSCHIIDLPGSYSLAPRSPDEMIAVDVMLGLQDGVPRPDAVVCIVDASNLERNLYLVSQVLELSLPTVLALNMTDVARDKGISLDVATLRMRLGVPVVEIQANRQLGVGELKSAIAATLGSSSRPAASPFPEPFQNEVRRLEQVAAAGGNGKLPRYLVERLLLDTSGFLAGGALKGVTSNLLQEVQTSREQLRAQGIPIPAVEALARYEWVGQVTDGVITRAPSQKLSLTDRLDRVLTHRLAGTLVFLLVMLAMFQSVFVLGAWASGKIDEAIGAFGEFVAGQLAEGPLRSLLVDGVIAGVGGVVVFLPQIFILFFFIALLEDCGYMARAAYLMDKLMVRAGLSGKSFIPLLSSFACAIPGIMSARVIENRRDRLLTIVVAPLMSCSARLPVYTLLIYAFIPPWQWRPWLPGLQSLVMLSMYLAGIVAAIAVAFILRRTLFRGPTPPFVMELPSYKLPSVSLVVHRMLESGWSFVRRAGTLILAVSVLIWAAAYYPRNPGSLPTKLVAEQQRLTVQLEQSQQGGAADGNLATHVESLQDKLDAVENEVQGEYLRQSYLGRLGRWIEPLVRPLGWDWRIGCAVIASFPAREVVVATLGVIYNLGEDQDEFSPALQETLRNATWDGTDRRVFNIPVALSLLVFFSLCAQCVSTLVVMRRETNSWRWPIFTFVYMTVLAYAGAWFVYQTASWIGV